MTDEERALYVEGNLSKHDDKFNEELIEQALHETRREMAEECAKMVCSCCARGVELTSHIHGGTYGHVTNAAWGRCRASRIYARLAELEEQG